MPGDQARWAGNCMPLQFLPPTRGAVQGGIPHIRAPRDCHGIRPGGRHVPTRQAEQGAPGTGGQPLLSPSQPLNFRCHDPLCGKEDCMNARSLFLALVSSTSCCVCKVQRPRLAPPVTSHLTDWLVLLQARWFFQQLIVGLGEPVPPPKPTNCIPIFGRRASYTGTASCLSI